MSSTLPWLEPQDPFPPPHHAWGRDAPAPGLLAAGGVLDVAHLLSAYRQGTFPWFSAGQPVLWWSPDPRMVLQPGTFRLHHSLRKTLQKFRANPRCEIRIDHGFGAVMHACANAVRHNQHGTWILPEMVAAYEAFHAAGHAHSVETWIDDKLAGGLYCVSLGHAVFGESMFAHTTDASKIALAALVCLCRRGGVALIDCQQNTPHLASLGAHEIARAQFLQHLQQAHTQPSIDWSFDSLLWNELVPSAALTP
ncbi:leucyl/phenylalanyl-tRNA--protein transferase [Simplicispira psychrophila]|uniref:leucyl/phenylalanyl-tRNA--protein transferase n=1 Tax=Simplicispira psychrophila TaxID=80882 RepID=UPI000484DB68|nr:leucyl/phenylalanyl-tRNA--protein transferase [Simplicispira psychrophila]